MKGVLAVVRGMAGWGAYWTDESRNIILYILLHSDIMMLQAIGMDIWADAMRVILALL